MRFENKLFMKKRRTIIPRYLKPTRYKTIIRRMRPRPKTWKSKHDTKKNINCEIGNGLKKVDILGVRNAGKAHDKKIKVNMKNATNPREKWDSTVEQILNPLRPISQLSHGLGNIYHQLLYPVVGCLQWRQMKIDFNFHDVCYGDKWKMQNGFQLISVSRVFSMGTSEKMQKLFQLTSISRMFAMGTSERCKISFN